MQYLASGLKPSTLTAKSANLITLEHPDAESAKTVCADAVIFCIQYVTM